MKDVSEAPRKEGNRIIVTCKPLVTNLIPQFAIKLKRNRHYKQNAVSEATSLKLVICNLVVLDVDVMY